MNDDIMDLKNRSVKRRFHQRRLPALHLRVRIEAVPFSALVIQQRIG